MALLTDATTKEKKAYNMMMASFSEGTKSKQG